MSRDIEKAKKLKRLAEAGVGGEALNAKELLDKFCESRGIRLEDLDELDEPEQWYFIKCYDYEKEILVQVIFMGANKAELQGYFKRGWNFKVKPSAFENVKYLWGIFRKAFNDQLAAFRLAFIFKNNIFSEEKSGETEKERTEEESKRIDKALEIASMLDAVEIFKALEGKT